MKRSEVTTPWLEAQLNEFDAQITRYRRHRHNLLRLGEIVTKLEKAPDLWVTLIAHAPECAPLDVTAILHLKPDNEKVDDLISRLTFNLGAPTRHTHTPDTINIVWSARGQGVFRLIINESVEIQNGTISH